MNASAPASVVTFRLAPATGIREAAAFRQSLLDLLAEDHPVVIDVSEVERVDTAALQLLFAFERDRRARGASVVWQGVSAAFRDGVKTLGLPLGADHGA
ncbi:MAG TPA: STAS domain-containing protein [Steroidobacteraceae bacterium]|nr:STAS domain-containing protein [Steroidobacteraceae bacterium]